MSSNRRAEFDPNEYQMTIGDHLEELRRRILLGLFGAVPAALLCLIFGQRIIYILCKPLTDTLAKYDINPQLNSDNVSDAFMVYIKISLITALVVAGPWLLYQIWQFVSAGLYPTERKYITKYIPLSIVLLMCGVVFVYFIVLPWSLQFFVGFTTGIPMPSIPHKADAIATTQPTSVQAIRGDPLHPEEYRMWFDTTEDRLKMFIRGQVRVIPFGANNLMQTHFTLPDYLDLVLQLLLSFGLAFQLPLVVMALARIGIVDIPMLRSFRRYVYFGLSLLAAALAPGDVVTATLALLVPLILLYEFGIFLAKIAEKKGHEERS